MNTTKLLKTGLKTLNTLSKIKLKTRRQKRRENILLVAGLIVGVALIAGGGYGGHRVLKERKVRMQERNMKNAPASNTGL